MGYYVMVDRPGFSTKSKPHRHYKVRHDNKPRREHLTLTEAWREAERLSKKLNSRVVILEVVGCIELVEKIT